MKNVTILYTSQEIGKAIKGILASPSPTERRVVIVAYLGNDASRHLASPKGLHVVCAPKPGATSPKAVCDLQRRKAFVQFAEKLHMKVYWSSKRGCVMGSANVSDAALDDGGNLEAGVWLPPGAVDIDRLLHYARPIPVTAETLRKLDAAWRKRPKAGRGKRSRRGSPKPPAGFLKWYNSSTRIPWKLIPYDARMQEWEVPAAARRTAREESGEELPRANFEVKRREVKEGDWVLLVRFGKDGRPSTLRWNHVDAVVPVTRSDEGFREAFCRNAVQIHPLYAYGPPPFALTPDFRRAFDKVVTPDERASGARRTAVLDEIASSMRRRGTRR